MAHIGVACVMVCHGVLILLLQIGPLEDGFIKATTNDEHVDSTRLSLPIVLSPESPKSPIIT